jgi:transcriptional regulator with XRE-family HTH domain
MDFPSVSLAGMVAIGESVREARRRAGLSQRHLGKQCGLDQSVISRLENRKLANLRWWRFAALVGALGESWDPGSRRPSGGGW